MAEPFSDLEPLLDLRPTPTGFEANTIATAHGSIFGAMLLFQQVLAAERATPGKRLQSLQTVFANGGRSGEEVQISVETLQAGRSFSFLTLTFRQGDLVVSRAEALLTAPEDDYLRLQPAASAEEDWAAWPVQDAGLWPGTVRRSPRPGPDEVVVSLGVGDVPDDPAVARALVAYGTEPLVMSALLELGQVPPAPAGRMPANVLTHSVSFLDVPDLSGGLVVRVSPTHAGSGRAHGLGQVLDPSGRLLATFSTSGVLRAPRVG